MVENPVHGLESSRSSRGLQFLVNMTFKTRRKMIIHFFKCQHFWIWIVCFCWPLICCIGEHTLANRFIKSLVFVDFLILVIASLCGEPGCCQMWRDAARCCQVIPDPTRCCQPTNTNANTTANANYNSDIKTKTNTNAYVTKISTNTYSGVSQR